MGQRSNPTYANLDAKTKIRSIVLVTMLSLLLTVLTAGSLRYSVFSFYKNFTCWLAFSAWRGLRGRGTKPCAPALCADAACSSGHHAFAIHRHRVLIFSVGWLSTFDCRSIFCSGSFILCAASAIRRPALRQITAQLDSLNAYGLNLMGSILGSVVACS